MKKWLTIYHHVISKNKEKLQRKVRERYQNVSEEETEEKRRYSCEKYNNFLKMENETWLGILKTFCRMFRSSS